MKYSYKLLFIFLPVLVFISCKNEPIMFDSSKTFVGFDYTSASFYENAATVDIPVMIAGFEGKSVVTVNYEISIDGISNPAIEGVDYTIGSDKAIDFPTGAGYSTITIHPIDNNILTGNKIFRITLTSNSKNLPMGRENSILVVIRDDEHPLKRWIGNYTVHAISYYLPGQNDENWTVTTDSDPDDVNKLLISGVGATGSNTIKATLNLDEMTITLEPGQSLGDVYGYGSISVYKGTDAGDDVIQDEPLIGVIEDDGTIRIDLWGELITDGQYAGYLWDVFNTTWTKQ
jgi:hypothetical protein